MKELRKWNPSKNKSGALWQRSLKTTAVEGFGAPALTQLFTGKIKRFGSEIQEWGVSREVSSWLFLAMQGQEINKATLSVNIGEDRSVYEKVCYNKSVGAGHHSENWPITTGLTQYELVT